MWGRAFERREAAGRVRGGGRTGRSAYIIIRCRESCCIPDHINGTFKIFKNIGIPKSDDTISVFLQFIGSLLIINKALRFVMLPTIEFNDQLAIVAGKVRDIFSNWNLAAKVTVLTFEQPKLLPQLLFCIGNVAAKLTSKLVSHLPTPTPNPSPQGGRGMNITSESPSPLWGGVRGGGRTEHSNIIDSINTPVPLA